MPQYLSTDPNAGRRPSGSGSLSANEEKRFRSWYSGMSKRYDLSPDPDDPEQFYDYRAAFRAGVKPDETGHWPSQFKRDGHPAMVVGGFHVQAGERVPGTKRATEDELVALGWDKATAKQLTAETEPTSGYISTDPTAGEVAPDFRAVNERDESGRPVVREVSAPGGGAQLGFAKGVGNTVVGLGELVHRIPGVSRAVDALYGEPGLSARAFPAARAAMQPSNTGERIGFTAEQMGEFFVPGGAGAKLAQVPKAALTTLAQTGDMGSAVMSGVVTGAMPAAGTLARASRELREGAQKTVVQALAPTKEWAKAEAKKLAPEIIRRGVRGSRQAMLQQAKAQTSALGQELDNVVQAAAQAGETVYGGTVRGAIKMAQDALKVTNQNGASVAIPGTEKVVKKLSRLGAFIEDLGDDIPVDKALMIRRTWDQIISKAGLFGQKAGAKSTDNAQAWALREASGAMRDLLNKNPALADINKELSFWTGLKKVLIETEKRTQSHGGGLVAAGMGGSGAVVGALQGDSLGERASNAVIGGLVGRQLIRLVQSPAWRTTVSAPSKALLADALASGQTGKILSAIGKITASLPSVAR